MDALYARQSVDKKDSISIETQLEFARKESKEGEYREYLDRGYSGKNTRRPDFKRMIDDAENGIIHRIIVYKIDRFSRSLLDFANIWEMLAKNGVEFVSVNEKFDTSTPIGKAMLFILMVFAQLERETISERVTDNYYQRAKLGRWTGGPAPYGFSIGRIGKEGVERGIPTLEANENIRIVIDNYEKYAGNIVESLGELSKILEEQGIAGAKRTTWNNMTLGRMFRNPVYVKADADIYAFYKDQGVNIANKLEEFTGEYACMLIGKRKAGTRQRKELADTTLVIANWMGQVDSDIWLKCQKKLDRNQQIGNQGKGKYSWLSGLLKCGYCNRSMRILEEPKNPEKRYLMCTGRIDHNCSHIPNIEMNQIEDWVGMELMTLLCNCSNEPMEEAAVISNQEKIELKQMEEQINNLIQCISSGAAAKKTVEYINEEIENLTRKQQKILNRTTSEGKTILLGKIDFKKLDLEEKKIVTKSYIDRVSIYRDMIDIVWKI